MAGAHSSLILAKLNTPHIAALAISKVQNLELVKVSSEKALEKELIGKIFHVTPLENLVSIQDMGLKPNTELKIKSKFTNTATGFFRLRGCVSFFDYRNYGSKTWKEHAYKCRPTQVLDRTNAIAILFLSEGLFDNLVPWTKWKEEEAYSQQVVPHIEIGYKGIVSMSHIDKVIILEPKNC